LKKPMSAHFLSGIDWQRPWLAPFWSVAATILPVADTLAALNAAAIAGQLRNQNEFPIHFVPQAELPVGMAYEACINLTGRVPTRDNLHDFFNALVWLTFPQIKARLNALQAAEIARLKGAHRGKLRDAATIFDENAALLVSSNADLINALRDHRWHEVFVMRRAEFNRDCEVWLFGHALLEKLISPYKAITAHAWVMPVDAGFFKLVPASRCALIDERVARELVPSLVTAHFTPLPILGVPGWQEDQDATFYSDFAVFRRKREAR
jgi:Protein of unknown function (DUF3025)